MISFSIFPLLTALGVLLVWNALTASPRVDVSHALDLEGGRNKSGLLDRLDDRFERAGLPISARELVSSGLLMGGIAALLTLVVTQQIVFAVFVALLGPAVVYLRAESKRDQAERTYQDELVGAMDVIRSSYAISSDIRGAIADAAQYSPGAVRGDFEHVQAMLVQGSNLEEAFAPIQARRRNLFLDMVVEAITLREEQGGSITDVMASIQELIREQGRIFQRMLARQTQARIEATVVCLAPIVFFVFVRTVFRDYEQGFYNTVAGQLVVIGALLLDGLAYVVSRKIARSGMEITRFEVA